MENLELESKKERKILPNGLFFGIAIALILFDQITKLAVKGFDFMGIQHNGFYFGETKNVIGTFLQWTYVENPGMAFGIEFGAAKIFLSLFSIIAGIALAIVIKKIRTAHFAIRLGFSMIFAGAVGNLIDRVFYGVFFHDGPLFYGKVVDFIQVDIPDVPLLHWTHFPVFNIADSCVTVGVVILILFHKRIPNLEMLFTKKRDNVTADEITAENTVINAYNTEDENLSGENDAQ